MTLHIVIIDVLGLTYDGNTLEKYGLGGSESSIILISKELTKLGFSVTVYNSCIDSRAKPGNYNGVQFNDLSYLDGVEHSSLNYDIVISSRSVRPFIEDRFAFVRHAKHRVLWMHDTFSDGDKIIEDLVVSGKINEIFTLSDFHTSYITTCFHEKRWRNFEVLKNHIFMTRNGVKRHLQEVDVTKKDKHLYVYNASLTKGMIPLVEKIWPKIKERIPKAKLKVIGGFYRFRDGAEPDDQEKRWKELSKRKDLKNLNIDFTGVIPQKEVAEILSKATAMLYPGAFPETFGISTLESLSYNTPLIGTRFGALEETAIDRASYLIDYAIENDYRSPANVEEQVQKFVDVVEAVHRNPYLHAQKMQYCNIVHEVSGWDTVALQWKQHFFRVFGEYLPVDEYRRVRKINERVHTIFGRRFSNPEEWDASRAGKERLIHIIVPFFNGASYIENCIRSIAIQDYDNYFVSLIDDASTDDGYIVARDTIRSLDPAIQKQFHLYQNETNVGAVANQVTAIYGGNRFILRTASPNIVMLLDGDDKLAPRNDIFQFYNGLYADGAQFTYGSSWSMADEIPLIGQPYPNIVKQNNTYRSHKFVWGMPYTHLRTFVQSLANGIKDNVFKDENGEWFRAGGDNALFYNLIEQASPAGVRAVQDITYIYNDLNPINDWKVHGEEQTQNASYITSQQSANEVSGKTTGPNRVETRRSKKRHSNSKARSKGK